MPNWLRGTEPCEAERCQCEARLKKRRPPEKRFFSFGHRPNYLSPYFQTDRKMAMDWMLDQTVDKEVKLLSKKFKGGNKKDGKGKG